MRRRVWTLVSDPDDDGPNEWRIFAPDGIYAGSLYLPPDAEVLDADEDRILLLRRTELDVEYVEVWRWSGARG